VQCYGSLAAMERILASIEVRTTERLLVSRLPGDVAPHAPAAASSSGAADECPAEDDDLSLGSRLHASGGCRPCHYVFKARGCDRGKACTFCHMPHTMTGVRPCQATREKCRRAVEILDSIADPRERLAVARELASEGKYMLSMLRSKLGPEDMYAITASTERESTLGLARSASKGYWRGTSSVAMPG